MKSHKFKVKLVKLLILVLSVFQKLKTLDFFLEKNQNQGIVDSSDFKNLKNFRVSMKEPSKNWCFLG
jgi:hypothetical protein